MKNNILIVALLLTITLQAQEKVKGNKQVSTVITNITDFQNIEIGDEYEVEIVRGAIPSVEITTDSNLHQYLKPEIIDGQFKMVTTANIRSSKEMKIRLIYPGNLGSIIVKDKATLTTVTDYSANELKLDVRDDAKVYITAQVENFYLNMQDGSKGEINFKGNSAKISLLNNASLKALLDYKEAEITAGDRIDGRIDGDMKRATIKVDGRAELNASNLIIDDLEVIVSNNATVKVNAKDNLTLKSSNDATTEIYSTPKITIEEFSGKSVLKRN